MGLQEEVEELTKQVAEAEKAESEVVEEEVKEPEAEEDPEVEEEPAEDDKPEEEEDPEPEEKPEEQASPAAYAKMRREIAALKKQVADKAPAAPVVQPIAAPVAPPVSAEPDKSKDPVAWFTWRDAQREAEINELKTWKEAISQQTAEVQLESAAVQEFKAIEAEFKISNPDFDDVADHFNNKLSESITNLNPYLSPEQVKVMVKDRVLRMAGDFVRQGLNPVEEMYHLSKDRYGYTAPVEEEGEDAPKKKPDLNKVAANRKRNAGTAAAKGAGSMPKLSREAAADMPAYEFAALPAEEKRRLLYGE